MNRREFLRVSSAASLSPLWAAQPRPNIVFIYADDLGWGDTGCYGARRVRTPNIDRLAARGLRFTDAHCSAATCTPSRFSLLTGEYSFRNQRARVLPGDAPLLIAPGKPTVASMLRGRGYRTGVVGKWHLGLGEGAVDWNKEIGPGPREVGFDYSFLMPATGDRVPCVYVENQRVVGLDPGDPIQVNYATKIGGEPTGRENPELLRMKHSHGHDFTIVNGVGRIGYMTGGKAARWKDEEMSDTFAAKGVEFIERSRQQPFFLYFATHDIHVPRVPHPRFAGKTPMGARGDAIAELDDAVGKLVAALERHRLLSNTMIVFSSDNGPVIDDGYVDEAVEKLGDHKPAGPFRGGKYSNFEGGTRVPFIVHWPARVKPGVSDALVSQVDLHASLAALAGHTPASGEAPDSYNLLPALLGESRTGRGRLVQQASVLSLRAGSWKYISPGKGPAVQTNTNTEMGNNPQPQLYDLAADPGERNNLAAQQPERVREMAALLDRLRSAPDRQTP